MLSILQIRQDREDLKNRLKIRGFKEIELIDDVFGLDTEKRRIKAELDQSLNLINSKSKEIGLLFQQGKRSEAEQLKLVIADQKTKSKELEALYKSVDGEMTEKLIQVPNVPHADVPAGISENDNLEIRNGGKMPTLADDAIPHWELGLKYGILDFGLGNKISGSGFPVFKGSGARLQRALINFFINEATQEGYLEIVPPLMVNYLSAYSTGQLPDKDGQMYYINEDNLYMIPTAEVPITNIYRDEIIHEKDLPVKMVGYTPCFRREAGSYGKEVRGLNRVHQFDKVEIVQLVNPDKSYDILDEMVSYIETLVNKLELPYRIVRLCGGDLGFTSAMTYDFEVYSAAQKKWLEVSSVSNFETFQANRLNLRMRDTNNKKVLAHTLNGSALALPRIIAALLENNQSDEGIKIPAVLQPYFGAEMIF